MPALISIRPAFLDLIFSGEKTAELRKNRVHLEPGELVWLYCTMPRSGLEGFAILKSIESSNKSHIWESYGKRLGITYDEFVLYVGNHSIVSAMTFIETVRFPRALKLQQIREYVPSFHPPQRHHRLQPSSDLQKLFHSHAESLDATSSHNYTI